MEIQHIKNRQSPYKVLRGLNALPYFFVVGPYLNLRY